jgi:hypothetical protein
MVKRIKLGIMCWFSYKGKGKAVLTGAMNVHRFNCADNMGEGAKTTMGIKNFNL